ncbi:N-acetylmuramoyl-L-alanine amidase [bacterium]|nr:N-acetylmuramoyl-L-alanine amidase [bacterium]
MDSRPLENINITIDPGHGDTKAYDNYRIGPTGEREEWINLRVAKILSRKLTRAGANVLMTRTKNKDVSLGGRAILASQHQSDLLVSIHHNASENDSTIDFPLVYFYGAASMNPASVDFANILINEMRNKMSFEQPNAGSVYSDHLIYNSGTSILRNSIDQMPGVIGEGGFFTNPEGERRLKSKEYNELEAEVYFQAIIKYFDGGIPTAKPLIPDTLDFLDFNSEIQFQLDDGFGNTFFEDNSFEIFQDGKRLNSSWDIRHGVLSAQPLITDENRISFQVLARNFKGNAIHPRPFSFYTEAGKRWYLEDDWFTAFRRADSLFTQFDSQHNLPLDERLVLLNEALHYYRLSLELQIVHPNALEAEKQVLVLLELKQELVGEDLQAEIEKQSSRLRDYYP